MSLSLLQEHARIIRGGDGSVVLRCHIKISSEVADRLEAVADALPDAGENPLLPYMKGILEKQVRETAGINVAATT